MEIIPVYDSSSLIERAMDNLREKLTTASLKETVGELGLG